MKYAILTFLFFLIQSLSFAQNQNNQPVLMMKDGQLRTHPIRVFVKDADIKKEMKPLLCLVAIDQITRKKYYETWCKGLSFRPFEVASGQTMTYDVEGTPITISGSIMLFDISNLEIPYYRTGMRVVPIINWDTNKVALPNGELKFDRPKVIGRDEIYIGNPIGAWLWTTITLILFFISVAVICSKSGKKFFDLIKIYNSESGNLSLSLTQMFLWTIAISLLVMVFSLMFYQVPHIPDSLIALMGLSVATGSIGQYQTKKMEKPPTNNGVTENSQTSENRKNNFFDILLDLIAIQKKDGLYPSIAKTQCLLWTIITIILFIWKSVLDGQLWSVPGELVVLMGISQSSYLIRNQMEIK